MKKITLLFGLATLLLFSGCSKQFSIKITSPTDGASVSILKDITVKIEATIKKGTIEEVEVCLTLIEGDDILLFPCSKTSTEPFTIIIPSTNLSLGKHEIRAKAKNSNGEYADASIIVKVISGEPPAEVESPDFVTFEDGKRPTGWIYHTWEIDNNIGYDDKFSLRSVGYPALAYANKTYKKDGKIEFYTKGGAVELFIDVEKATPTSSTPAGDWTKWVYAVEKDSRQFKWQANGVSTYLDAIRFY